uniref:ORF118 n=1 Tax=Malaco herpesvirus 1 TaxID=3031797 RepID=A0AA48P7U9_9VIRU|nr:TPA_asm: ORF118 [Malaco herpesvirus 1]
MAGLFSSDDRIESRGAEPFSLMPNGGLGAKKLDQILKKYHNVSTDVSTDLIHPTVTSILALDMLESSHRYSMYANEMFKHMRDLVEAFKLYLIGDAVKIAKNSLVVDPVIFQQDNVEEVAEETLEDTIEEITSIFDEINFLARVEKISEKFKYAVKLSLALGFCPCIPTNGNDGCVIRPDQRTYFGTSKTLIILDSYLAALEYSLSKVSFLSINKIISDLIITDQTGVKTATLISKPNKVISSLNFTEVFCPNGTDSDVNLLQSILKSSGGNLTFMVQFEIQLAFARNESKNYLLERMKKTQLVVGTEMSSEAKSILNNIIKSEIESSTSTAILKKIEDNEKLNKDMEKINEKRLMLENTSAELQKRVSDMIRSKDEELTARAVALASKTREINISKLNNRILEKNDRSVKEAEEKRMRINCGENVDVYHDVFETDTTFGLYPMGSKQNQRDDNVALKAKQDLDLKKERDVIDKQLKVEKMRTNILQQTLNEEVVKNEALVQKQKEMEIQVKSHEEKEKILTKIMTDKDSKIKELEVHLNKTSDYISKAAESLQLSHKDRDRVLKLINDVRVNNSYITSGEKNDVFITELINYFGSFNTMTQESLDIINKRNFSRVAYDQVLSENCVRPTPIFYHVHSERDLNRVNEWVPLDWMRDRPVRDAIAQSHDRDLSSTYTSPSDSSDQAVMDTRELYVLDVNPVPMDVEQKLKQHMSDNMEMSTYLPALQKRFMSVQFKSIGNVKEHVENTVQTTWESFITSIFRIGRDRVTVVGQKMDPMITNETLRVFMTPFLRVFDGIQNLSADVINNVIKNLLLQDNPIAEGDFDSTTSMIITSILKPYINKAVHKRKRIIAKATRIGRASNQQPTQQLIAVQPTQNYGFITGLHPQQGFIQMYPA